MAGHAHRGQAGQAPEAGPAPQQVRGSRTGFTTRTEAAAERKGTGTAAPTPLSANPSTTASATPLARRLGFTFPSPHPNRASRLLVRAGRRHRAAAVSRGTLESTRARRASASWQQAGRTRDRSPALRHAQHVAHPHQAHLHQARRQHPGGRRAPRPRTRAAPVPGRHFCCRVPGSPPPKPRCDDLDAYVSPRRSHHVVTPGHPVGS